MPNCARYYRLRAAWENAEHYLLEIADNPAAYEARDITLSRLRAHAEICDECIDALFAPFPQAVGKQRIMLSVGAIAS
jgi:hypothetical protein